jgi:hypothetical protein
MSHETCIRTFANQFEAEIARSTLQAEGIDAFLSSDDVGGELPATHATLGIRLFVASADADRAVSLLLAQRSEDDVASGDEAADDVPVEQLADEVWRRSILPALILGVGAALALLVQDVAPALRVTFLVIAAVIATWVRRTG